MILVLHYYKSIIDGVMTSLIDTFFNLRDLHMYNIQMKIICPELYLLDKNDYYDFDIDDTQWYEYIDDNGLDVKPYKGNDEKIQFHLKAHNNEITTAIPFLRFNRNFGNFNLFYSIDQTNKKFKADTIICSGRLIYEILMGEDIELECDKLIILDSLDTYRSKIGIFPDFDDLFDTMFKNCDIIQLSNPATFRETKYKQIEYYHKFSLKRLRALRKTQILKDKSYVFDRTNKEKTMITEGLHFENLGKGIFENAYFGNPVEYKKDGMFMKDGLWYYMNLFGLDANKNQPIILSKKLISDKLFFNGDDVLRGIL